MEGLLPAAVGIKDEEEGVCNAGNIVDSVLKRVVQLEIVGCLGRIASKISTSSLHEAENDDDEKNGDLQDGEAVVHDNPASP